MFACPVCGAALNRTSAAGGLVWICPTCNGRAVNLAVLRRAVNQQQFNRLWQTAWEGALHTDRKCPSCEKPMVEVPLMPPPDPLVLDACRACQFVWFDASELEKIPAAPAPAPTPEEEFRRLPLEAREAIAMEKVRQMAEQARREEMPSRSPEPTVWWEVLPAIVELIAD